VAFYKALKAADFSTAAALLGSHPDIDWAPERAKLVAAGGVL
jgi:hypothetical protein